jgi:hypothetical protein
MEFVRSSFCDSAACIEVADAAQEEVIIRNSVAPDYVVLATRDEWAKFIQGVKAGEFDFE